LGSNAREGGELESAPPISNGARYGTIFVRTITLFASFDSATPPPASALVVNA
jgi:hypothetical protein